MRRRAGTRSGAAEGGAAATTNDSIVINNNINNTIINTNTTCRRWWRTVCRQSDWMNSSRSRCPCCSAAVQDLAGRLPMMLGHLTKFATEAGNQEEGVDQHLQTNIGRQISADKYQQHWHLAADTGDRARSSHSQGSRTHPEGTTRCDSHDRHAVEVKIKSVGRSGVRACGLFHSCCGLYGAYYGGVCLRACAHAPMPECARADRTDRPPRAWPGRRSAGGRAPLRRSRLPPTRTGCCCSGVAPWTAGWSTFPPLPGAHRGSEGGGASEAASYPS